MPVGNKFAESQGLSYVPNDMYLQEDFKGSTPLDFSNVSSSGIMSQVPVRKPLVYIPENGGEGPVDIGPKDYGYTGLGSTGSAGGFNIYDIEEGTIDDEDIKNNQAQLSKMDLIKAGLSTMFGPIAAATSIYRSQKKAEKKMRDKIDADIAETAAKGNYTPGGSHLSRGTSGGGLGLTEKQAQSVSQANKDAGYSSFSGLAKGGRVGYFFGGRVNYKVGGRTDAGANRSTASHSTRGQINEAGQQVNNNSGNDGGNDKSIFYSPPDRTQTVYENTLIGRVPVGLTRDLDIGRLTGILNAKKSFEEKDLEGKLQYDSSIGPINTTMSYDTTTGPEFNANYTRNNLNTNFNSKKGLGFNYSKDIGPGKFTAGGSYGSDGTFNTEAKYGITFANGGLASIL